MSKARGDCEASKDLETREDIPIEEQDRDNRSAEAEPPSNQEPSVEAALRFIRNCQRTVQQDAQRRQYQQELPDQMSFPIEWSDKLDEEEDEKVDR